MKNNSPNSFKYSVLFSASFKKDYKTIQKRHFKLPKLLRVIEMLADDEPLPAKYRNHTLSGKWSGYYECHIAPDWLLVYKKENDILVLTLTRTGTHADIF